MFIATRQDPGFSPRPGSVQQSRSLAYLRRCVWVSFLSVKSKRDTGPGEARTSGYDTPAEHAARSPGGIGHETGELHRLLVDSVRDYAIFALDPNGFVLSWNAGAEHIKGYRPHEIIGKHFSIFYPPDKVAEQFPQFELEVATRVGRFEDEGWRIRKNGTRFWASVVITALRDAGGNLVGFAKVTRDLTERRRAEQALQMSEERFRLLIHSVRDYAIFMLDPNGKVATWNEGAERAKGYTEDEILGRHFSVFYPEEDLAAGKPARELEIAKAEGRYEEEGWRVRKDGTRFWANVTITAIRNEKGTLIGFAKVTRDLTERLAAQERALEGARRVAAEETARSMAEVRERETRGLLDELRRQSIELAAANSAKAQFLASMSHELRTPLNAIGGYVDLLSIGVRGPVTSEQQQDLERIKRSQQHLVTVISDILNYSRTEAGQLTYDFSSFRVDDLIRAVMPMVLPQAEAKGIALARLECPPDLTMWADRSRAEQIVLNLLSNSVKFSDEGDIEVSCREDDDAAVVSVRDHGRGIPEDQIGRIFEPFVQVGRSLASPQEGTGLGLAISRDLARAMGGDITAESALGQGATFSVRLPRVPPPPGTGEEKRVT